MHASERAGRRRLKGLRAIRRHSHPGNNAKDGAARIAHHNSHHILSTIER